MRRWFCGSLFAVGLAFFNWAGSAHAALLDVGDVQVGTASYYSDRFHGRRTASGERYNRDGLTAVHARLPFGTVIKVTNLRNGRSVHLRVNDRTRLRHGRVLDVSKRAARELGFIGSGLARVEVEVVRYGEDDS